jgi:hypothetical protein
MKYVPYIKRDGNKDTKGTSTTPEWGITLTKSNIILDVQCFFLRVRVVPGCILQLRLCSLVSITLMEGSQHLLSRLMV